MFVVSFSFILIAGSLAAQSTKLLASNERLTATIDEYPYHASIRIYDQLIGCSAAIIDSRWVVSDARCIRQILSEYPVFYISVGFGADMVGSQYDESVPITGIYEHPNYDPDTLENNIALVSLAEELVFGSTVSKVDLPDVDATVAIGSTANVSGWMMYVYFLRYLQASLVTIVDLSDCEGEVGNPLSYNKLCTTFPESSDEFSCLFYDGGPLVQNNVLIGIASWTGQCISRRSPVLYTNVAAVRSFIADITGL